MSFEAFNGRRLYQAMILGSKIKEAGLGATEHRVLENLARRMATKTVPGKLTIEGTCFPGIATIVKDTMLADRTVRYALARLIEHGFIEKTMIPGRKLRGRPGGQSPKGNQYDNCRYHVTPVWDAVVPETPFDGIAAGSKVSMMSPAPAPKASAEELQAIDTIVEGPPAAQDAKFETVTDERRSKHDYILKIICEVFSGHPSLADQKLARTYTHPAIDKALDHADVDLVGCALATLPESVRAATMASTSLGGYLKTSILGWVHDFAWRYAAEAIERAALNGVDDVACGDAHRREVCELALRHVLGDDLAVCEDITDDEGNPGLRVQVSDAYTAKYLADHSNEAGADQGQEVEEEKDVYAGAGRGRSRY